MSGGSLTLGNPGSSTQSNFTGNVAVSNGTISVVGYQYGGPNPGQSPLGDTATVGQTVTINNGGVLQFGNNSNNIIGGPFPALAVTTSSIPAAALSAPPPTTIQRRPGQHAG